MYLKKLVFFAGFLLMQVPCCWAINLAQTMDPVRISDKQGRIITIRPTEESDFEAIGDLGVRAFGHAYNFTTSEQFAGLKRAYVPIMTEEIAQYKSQDFRLISLVADCGKNVVGYFSANFTEVQGELYGRYLAVDPLFQNQEIASRILSQCYELVPELKRVVCVTKKTNSLAQNLYKHFGGRQAEKPYWVRYLYGSLNPQDYIGYEFDQAAVTKFGKVQDESVVHLTPPSIGANYIQDKVTCIRPKHHDSCQVHAEIKNAKLVAHNYGHGGAGWTQLFGSAAKMIQNLETLIEQNQVFKGKEICVIGAGCMGLLSAIMLTEKGYSVKIIAEQQDNLTSHKAAGVFFPASMYAASNKAAEFKEINETSLQEYCQIINGQHRFIPSSAARFMPVYVDLETDYLGLDFWREPTLVTIDFGNGKSYQVKQYEGIFIEVVQMMQHLQKRAAELGIIIEQGHVDSFDDLAQSVIVNCSGLGAKKLNADKGMEPLQGHLLMLKDQPKAEALQYMVHSKVVQNGKEAWVYFAPKGFGLLGVSFVEGDDRLDSNAHEFDLMLERAGRYFGFAS